jgi:hypothetical protein
LRHQQPGRPNQTDNLSAGVGAIVDRQQLVEHGHEHRNSVQSP